MHNYCFACVHAKMNHVNGEGLGSEANLEQ